MIISIISMLLGLSVGVNLILWKSYKKDMRAMFELLTHEQKTKAVEYISSTKRGRS